MTQPETTPTEKAGIRHHEVALDDVSGVKGDFYNNNGPVKSRFDEMSVGRTAWVFRRVAFIALAVYTGYVCEGFEVSTNNVFHDSTPKCRWLSHHILICSGTA
jgi:MFS transporter, SP family, general alpha glucoside:H+ symporter